MFDQGPFPSRNREIDDEVNLTPMMNLFVVLIPFLLTSTVFFRLGAVNASVPTIASAESSASKNNEKPLTIHLKIEPKGFAISGTGEYPARMLQQLKSFIPKQGGSYSYQKLNLYLSSIKRKYPKGETVMLFPSKLTAYREIVMTMDATRWVNDPSGAGKTGKRLYPDIVLTSLAEYSP